MMKNIYTNLSEDDGKEQITTNTKRNGIKYDVAEWKRKNEWGGETERNRPIYKGTLKLELKTEIQIGAREGLEIQCSA